MNRESVAPSFGKCRRGWTLVELLVALSIIGLLIGFMVPRLVSRTVSQARIAATRQQMEELSKALVGDPRQVVEGELVSVGYRGDVGAWPPPAPGDTLGLTWLWLRPPGVPIYDFYTKRGWNGPYIRADSSKRFLDDSWGNPYRFIRDENRLPIGLESAGPDGLFVPPPANAAEDNIQVRW
jgi:prepilin-type N-terminal cleavage/methylation domain-containing protein